MAWGLGAGHVDDAGHTAGAAAGNTPEVRRKAVLVVAANAWDAAECLTVLDMLGLTAVEARKAEAA